MQVISKNEFFVAGIREVFCNGHTDNYYDYIAIDDYSGGIYLFKQGTIALLPYNDDLPGFLHFQSCYFSYREIKSAIARHYIPARKRYSVIPLSGTELYVLRLALRGLTNAGIAALLTADPKVISRHKKAALAKLNVRNLTILNTRYQVWRSALSQLQQREGPDYQKAERLAAF